MFVQHGSTDEYAPVFDLTRVTHSLTHKDIPIRLSKMPDSSCYVDRKSLQINKKTNTYK